MKESYHGVLTSPLSQPLFYCTHPLYFYIYYTFQNSALLVLNTQFYFKDISKIKGKCRAFISFYHFQCSSFLCVYSDLYLETFFFSPKSFLYHFLEYKSASDEFFQCLYAWERIYFIFFLKGIFTEHRILHWQAFVSFNTLKMLLPFFLASITAEKKSALILIFVTLPNVFFKCY